MAAEIEKLTTGQSRNHLMKMWQEDYRRNEEISNKRWENKNLVWLNKYEEFFKIKYQNKSPYVKISEETEKKKTYAEVSAGQPQVRRQRPKTLNSQNQGQTSNQRQLQISTETQQQRQDQRQEGVPVQS